MAPGGRGTIDEKTGVYTAPSSVSARLSYGGCQVLPNNHIFNTRVDSLPVDSHSSSWIASASSGVINYISSFAVNYADADTPVKNLTFVYTPEHNGGYLIPTYPGIKVESGYFASLSGSFDKHVFVMDPSKCRFQEIYNLIPVGFSPRCPTCTAVGGVRYLGLTYDLPVTGATNAAGTFIIPLMLTLQEFERALGTGGTINHALLFTLKNNFIARSFIWPATANAYAPWGTIPYGARFRLRSSFDITKFSPAAQILLTQLKQYGIILTDGGIQWQIGTEDTKWPPNIQSAFTEVREALRPTDMEAVDESSLMVSLGSGYAQVGAEEVVATSVKHPDKSAEMPVVLAGVTVDFLTNQKYIQAGTPPQKFVAYVGGTDNHGVAWSMNPSLGTLSPDGLYSPPKTVPLAQVMTVTATSVVDSSASTQMAVTIFPPGPIRIALGRPSLFTDPDGKVWQASTGYDTGIIFSNGWVGTETATNYIFRSQLYAWGDIRFDFTVPNGNYQVIGKFASTNTTAPGQATFNIDSQGEVIHRDVDVFAQAGGEYKPLDIPSPAKVTNGQLSYVLRHVTGGNVGIAAIEIVPVETNIQATPPNPAAGSNAATY
ncbi:MAG: malectin domain-containing carbohydrate-binding protein [Candidatus Acidiferrum sp.]